MAILADVDEVLVRHSADTAQVVAAGQQLIYTAFGTRLRLSESRVMLASTLPSVSRLGQGPIATM